MSEPTSAVAALTVGTGLTVFGVATGLHPAVRVAPLSEIIAKHTASVVVDIPCDDPAAVIAAARSQVGKPYDLTALLGLLVRRDWQEAASWFCSELVAWAFAQGGAPMFRPEALYRVTPQHLWMIAK